LNARIKYVSYLIEGHHRPPNIEKTIQERAMTKTDYVHKSAENTQNKLIIDIDQLNTDIDIGDMNIHIGFLSRC
jgi:hypothetical protein